jgi:ATP-binding cassette subfamily C protein LapB
MPYNAGPLPADLIKALCDRLAISIEAGAVEDACRVEPEEGYPLPLVARITSLFQTLRLDRVNVAQLRWSRFDLQRLPALILWRARWWLVEPGEQTGQVRLTGSDGTVLHQPSETLDSATVIWLSSHQPADQAEQGWLGDIQSPASRLVLKELFRHRRWVSQVVVATVLINLLAVSTSLYAMQVYDRVVPTLAYATLTTLVVGMLLIITLDWFLKNLRARILDRVARRVDQAVSEQVFSHLIKLRLDERPNSLGTLAAQMSGLDAVRQFFSSSVIFGLVDLPFVVLFIGLIYVIGGAVAWVYVLLLPISIAIGLLGQIRVRGLLRSQMLRSNERQGLLVDVIRGTESIRAANASWRFENEWKAVTSGINAYNLKQKELSNNAFITSGSLSTLAYVSAVVVGVSLIEVGNLSMGGLIACSILGGRVLGPVAQGVRQLLNWEQVSQALEMVSGLLSLATERGRAQDLITPYGTPERISLQGVRFSYRRSPAVHLDIPSLEIRKGERVVVLGAVGSGKSTMLKMLAGQYPPNDGRVWLGNADIWEMDPNLVADQVGYLPQTIHLFKGNLKSNLALSGAVNDTRLMEVVTALGIDRMAIGDGQYLNLPISEGGEGLSEGQRQLVGLARLFLARPNIWLLDEPSAALDQQSEQRFWSTLKAELTQEDILIMSTHHPLLARQIATRILLLQEGRIVRDGPPEQVLAGFVGSGRQTLNAGLKVNAGSADAI